MINVIVKGKDFSEPNLLAADIANVLKDIDLSAYKIKDYILYVVFNMDKESIKNVSDLDGGKKYILFQNIPSETNYDIGFEAALSKFRIRLQRFAAIDKLQYENVVFVFDFSQDLIKDGNMTGNETKESKDRRAMFVPIDPKYKLDSVVMSDEMESEIEDALSIIRNRDKIYVEWGYQEVDSQARAVLCFYGPGGTGKTKCAHGVASALGRKILCVNYANIESMWAGESPKNLISAFNVAQESNAVLFMDEADSFLGKRITNVTSGHDQSINSLRSQMLILLEEFDGVVIFGTNLVENFDKAFETRILKNIKFNLPDEPSRIKLFKLMIPDKVPFVKPLSENDYLGFAQMSDGFSGREIKNIVLDTLSKGAKENVSLFTPQMFSDAIFRHAESLKRLKEDKIEKEKIIENALKDSILSESEKLYHEALVNIAIYAMKSDGRLDEKEQNLVFQTAKVLNVEIENFNDDDIPSLPVVCEHFSTAEQKRAALDLACKIIIVDNNIVEEEKTFIKKLYSILCSGADNYSDVIEYLELLANTNKKLSLIKL
jgi:AAA+ superfamily predicted ATPase